MALTKLESDVISEACQVAKRLLSEFYGPLARLNVIYDSAGGVKTTVTQSELDEIPSFSGMTKQQLDDGVYVLTALIYPALRDSINQISHIAARG